jgi:hypothetical protein
MNYKLKDNAYSIEYEDYLYYSQCLMIVTIICMLWGI